MSISLRYVTWSGTAQSYGSSIFTFARRNAHLFSTEAFTRLHSQQQQPRGPVSPHTGQHLFFSVSWIPAALVDGKWYLIVLSICVYLMTTEVEHLFKCLLTTGIFSLVIYAVKSFAHFKNRVVFLLLSCKGSLHSRY